MSFYENTYTLYLYEYIWKNELSDSKIDEIGRKGTTSVTKRKSLLNSIINLD